MPHPYDSIPELAGIATYETAAHVGYSVAENVRRFRAGEPLLNVVDRKAGY